MIIPSDEPILCCIGTNTFGIGDNVLEINTVELETNMLKTCVRASVKHTHTHTAACSYQRLPNKIYVEMIAIVTTKEIQRVS